MLKHRKNYPCVLSVYPTIRGYSYVLFTAPYSLQDWGSRHIKKDVGSAKSIESVNDMLARYRPDVLVLEDTAERGTKRTLRVKRIAKALGPTAANLSIEVAYVSRKSVRSAFAFFGAVSKQDIARVIAEKMDALALRMPKERSAWQAQDPRMALFDAASRGLTYYYQLEEVRDRAGYGT